MSTRTVRLLSASLDSLDLPKQGVHAAGIADLELIDEARFARLVVSERKRTERSSKPFLLMLIEGRQSLCPVNGLRNLRRKLVSILQNFIRETDSIGWYKLGSTVGVIFTEVGMAEESVITAILAKITQALRRNLSLEQLSELKISVYRYPDDERPTRSMDCLAIYPEISGARTNNRISYPAKRILDFVVSALLLIVLAPLFFIIAVMIKVTSSGPVLYKQKRVGQYGVPFNFLKFRSMQVNSDPGIHKEYISRLISGDNGLEQPTSNQPNGVYKITHDPRVTRVGRFLRRSSLDELPQLWNVLKGEMSLVGPRPPLPYEVEYYNVWHRNRIFMAKPGITGLWQVTGRSRTTFDEMVRLDIRYAKTWSLWLDLKILWQTPRAVFSGDGAY